MIQRILAKQLPIVLLKWCPYVGAPLYRLPLPNLTLRRTVHDKRDWRRHWHGLCLSWLHWWPRPLLGPAYVSTSDGCSSQQSYLAAGKTNISGSESPLFLHLSSPLNHCRLCARVKLYPEACGVRVIAPFRLRYAGLVGCEKHQHPMQFQPTLSSQAESSQASCTLLRSRAQASQSPLFVSQGLPIRQGDSSSLVMGPRNRGSNMGLDHILPRGIPACVILFFFFPGDQVQTSSLPFLPYLIPLWTFPSQCCIGVFLSTPS